MIAWHSLASGLALHFIVALSVSGLERIYPLYPRQRFLRHHWGQDLVYTILFAITRLASRSFFFWVFWIVAWQSVPSGENIWKGYGPIHELPFWSQAILALVLYDALDYWMHRLFHASPALWRVHAIHHQPQEIDAFSGGRFHPLEAVAIRFNWIILFASGFDPVALGATGLFSNVMSCFVHANVSFRFGLLEKVLATPHFHRWHHAKSNEARDKNFAALFPIWDILFRTHFECKGRPDSLGIEDPMPSQLVGQLAHPFKFRADPLRENMRSQRL